MFRLYPLVSYVLMPLLMFHLAWRGLRERDYLRRWSERFAFYRKTPPPGGIVVHAVSVGEVNAAIPLIHALRHRFPEYPMCITSFTPTGSDRIRSVFDDDIYHVYAPLDLPGAVKRFLNHVQPRLFIIMETEIWPNLYTGAARRDIPLLIANARISAKSLPAYKRLRFLIRATLSQVTRFAARSETDAKRLCEIGADAGRVEVTGNLKFDMSLQDDLTEEGTSLRMAWGEERPVLLAASTHQGDEGPVLEAFQGVLSAFPRALLVLVPRHPERFEPAAQLAVTAGLRVHRYSEGLNCPSSTQCFLVDAMGELLRFYAACDIAFVGGSFDKVGGHNIIEPAVLSVPVLIGPHTFNFEDITAQMLSCGGALRVRDAEELEVATLRLLGDEALRSEMGEAGLSLVRSGQGALSHTLRIAEKLLENRQIV